jgi:hypothetical protein
MSTEKTNDVATQFTQCEHWGKGGRFVFDPATGTRTLVDPLTATTAAADEQAAAGDAGAIAKATAPAPKAKEKQHG